MSEKKFEHEYHVEGDFAHNTTQHTQYVSKILYKEYQNRKLHLQ